MRLFLKCLAGVLGLLGIVLLYGWWQVDGPGTAVPGGQHSIALSEMNFRLTDHEGALVDSESLISSATMVFFGFTYCPDVCPTTLADITAWLDALGDDAKLLNVIFITVDPERDTVEAMAEYISNFHSAIRGWTGSKELITQAANEFRVNFERVVLDNGGYTMNHTASVQLYDAAGRYAGTIDYHEPRGNAVPKIRRVLNRKIVAP